MIDLLSPLAVVCHDAGSANIIIAWLRDCAMPLRPVMEGPARLLWRAAFPSIPILDSIEQALDGAATLLSGTGWASDLEHNARREACSRRVFSVAVIDHWVNYPDRFSRKGETVWPDEFWVTDEDAYQLACGHFPAQQVRRQANQYLRQQVERIPTSCDTSRVLYVLEPARNTWDRDIAGEFQALDFFLTHRGLLGLPEQATISLRPHPSDPPGKYDAVLSRHPTLEFDHSQDIAQAIGSNGWVVGTESFALVVALHAGRHVVCTLPPWAPSCRLPHKELIHLKNLLCQ